MSKIVFNMVPSTLEDINAFILNLPACATKGADSFNVAGMKRVVGCSTVVIDGFTSFFMCDQQFTPIDQ